jgi:hypothetical protein
VQPPVQELLRRGSKPDEGAVALVLAGAPVDQHVNAKVRRLEAQDLHQRVRVHQRGRLGRGHQQDPVGTQHGGANDPFDPGPGIHDHDLVLPAKTHETTVEPGPLQGVEGVEAFGAGFRGQEPQVLRHRLDQVLGADPATEHRFDSAAHADAQQHVQVGQVLLAIEQQHLATTLGRGGGQHDAHYRLPDPAFTAPDDDPAGVAGDLGLPHSVRSG